jgi:hypothetical protein
MAGQLSTRAERRLFEIFDRIEPSDVATKSRYELFQHPELGWKTIAEIETWLNGKGYKLRPCDGCESYCSCSYVVHQIGSKARPDIYRSLHTRPQPR